MSTPRVVHVSDNIPGAIYIGRANRRKGLSASPLANPYRIGRDGTRAEVIEKYRSFLVAELLPFGRTIDELRQITGKPLACWCRHDGEERTDDNACHADVLVAMIEELGLESEDAND